jgi:hypothetical protein
LTGALHPYFSSLVPDYRLFTRATDNWVGSPASPWGTRVFSSIGAKGAEKLLEGREEVAARLKVVATDAAGNKTILRRRVRLVNP